MNNESEDMPQIAAVDEIDCPAILSSQALEFVPEVKSSRSLKEVHQGSKFSVVHCVGALESYEEAMREKSQQAGKVKSMANGLALLIERLGDGHQMSGDSFPFEGELPNKTRFRAFKRIPIRAYVWLSERFPNVYFISHYKYKLKDKLDQNDSDRVTRNWTRIEVENDDR